MSGSKLWIAFAVFLFLTPVAVAAEHGVNGTAVAPDTGATHAIQAPQDGFIDKSAKYCASGYALGAATAMVAGLIGAGLPFTLAAITGSAAVGCGVAWIGSTAADGFFWMRDQSNELMADSPAGE